MQSISENSFVEWEISKSQFLGYSFYVEDFLQAEQFISELWKQYPKATHICWATKIGDNVERFDDNGEPSYTAGMPILDVIKKRKLTNVLVAVVRFYGGVKLGAGGLVRAYSKTASMVCYQSQEASLSRVAVYNYKVNYDRHLKTTNAHFLKSSNAKILKNFYENEVGVQFAVLKEEEQSFVGSLKNDEDVFDLVFEDDMFVRDF